MSLGGAVFFTGVGLLGYHATHQSFTVTVDTGAPTEPHPRLTLTSLGLKPMRNGLGAGIGFSF